MFGFFRRTKLYEWELQLFRNIIEKLIKKGYPNDFLDQLNDGSLFKSITTVLGYIAFSVDMNFINKFEKLGSKSYDIVGIKVFDKKSNNYLDYKVIVHNGLLIGFSIEGKKPEIDFNMIDVSNCKKQFRGNKDFDKISHHFSSDELKLFSSSEVYIVELNDVEYFHIKDLEDGDFIAVDIEKNIYEIRHDPFEIKRLSDTFRNVLMNL